MTLHPLFLAQHDVITTPLHCHAMLYPHLMLSDVVNELPFAGVGESGCEHMIQVASDSHAELIPM